MAENEKTDPPDPLLLTTTYPDFKAGVVRLVLNERKTVGAVARNMNLTETAGHPLCPRQDPARRGSY